MDSSDSESVVSTSTFDDSYYDQEINYDFRQSNLYNYVAETHAIIKTHEDITIENALSLNTQLRKMLEDLKIKFEKMLIAVREKYKVNETLLEQMRNNLPEKGGRNASIYICGAPYFKDNGMGSCPNNPNYLYRKNVLQEFFPFDYFSQAKRLWTTNDKKDIVKGVKEQMVNFLKQGSSTNISMIRSQKKASRSASKKIESIRGSFADLERKSFAELWNLVDSKKFVIDWNVISFKNLDSRHSATECMGMWNQYLRPGLNYDAWSAQEDERLQDAVIRFNYQDWEAISTAVGNRSPMQCLVHYRTSLSESVQVKKYEKFTSFEDHQLLELVEKYSENDSINWGKVCQQMPGRNRYQCYHRYMFSLKPGIRRERFTVEEDCAIMAWVAAHGENFGSMPLNFLSGRTGVQVRARYMNTLKMKGSNIWTPEEDRQLVEFVEKNGTKGWSDIAKIFGNKSRFGCRCRYLTIKKHLERYPNATIENVPRKDKPRSTNITPDNFLAKAAELQKQKKSLELMSQMTDHASIATPAKRARNQYSFDSANKLEITERRLYNFIKMSCNWNFCQQISNEPSRDQNEILRTFTTLQMLDLDLDHSTFSSRFTLLPPKTQNDLTNVLNYLIPTNVRDDIKKAKNYICYMPPNYNTIAAWRGMNIVFHDQSLVVQKKPKLKNYQQKLDLFKRRFKQLFYLTALLSRIDWTIVQERLKTVNICFDDSGMPKKLKRELSESPTIINYSVIEQVRDPDDYMKSDELCQTEDEENAVDFLLSHIKASEQCDIEDEQIQEPSRALDMPDYCYEITCLDSEQPTTEIVNVGPTKFETDSKDDSHMKSDGESKANKKTLAEIKRRPVRRSMPFT